jgi:hypothetical protein
MSGAQEKVQSDFDLERFIDMFDEALTSNDERVINALRSLMMMVILTKSEVRNEGHDRNNGPLRQLFDDLHNLNRRMHSMEDTVRQLEYQHRREFEEQQKARDVYRWPDKSYSARDFWDSDRPIAMSEDAYKAAMQKFNSLPKTLK